MNSTQKTLVLPNALLLLGFLLCASLCNGIRAASSTDISDSTSGLSDSSPDQEWLAGNKVDEAPACDYSQDCEQKSEMEENIWDAASTGNLVLVKQLAANGIDVTDENDETPLHSATQEEHHHVIEWLVNNGANVHAKDESGFTALHHASSLNNQEIVTLLLDAGAHVDDVNDEGETALFLAVADKDSKEIVTLLLDRGANRCIQTIPSLFDAVYSQVDAILEQTPLHVAATQGLYDVAMLLITHGIETQSEQTEIVNAKGEIGVTPLHLAALHGHLLVVELLVAHGADVNIRTEKKYHDMGKGWTAHDCASFKARYDIVATLNRIAQTAVRKGKTPTGKDEEKSHDYRVATPNGNASTSASEGKTHTPPSGDTMKRKRRKCKCAIQ